MFDNPQSAIAVFAPLGLAITALACAFSIGKAVSAAMEATARQPEAATKILINMMAGCALIEALALYALVFCNGLLGKF